MSAESAPAVTAAQTAGDRAGWHPHVHTVDHYVIDKILRRLERKEADRERAPPGAADLEVAS